MNPTHDNLFIYLKLYPEVGVVNIEPLGATVGYIECHTARAYYAWGRQDTLASQMGYTAYIDADRPYEPADSTNDIIRVTRNDTPYGGIRSKVPMPIYYDRKTKKFELYKLCEIPDEEHMVDTVHPNISRIWFKFKRTVHEAPDWKQHYVPVEIRRIEDGRPLGDFNAYFDSPYPKDWLVAEKQSTTPTIREYTYELSDMGYDYRIPKIIEPNKGLVTPSIIVWNGDMFKTENLIEMCPLKKER